jgi:hypothetical protein
MQIFLCVSVLGLGVSNRLFPTSRHESISMLDTGDGALCDEDSVAVPVENELLMASEKKGRTDDHEEMDLCSVVERPPPCLGSSYEKRQ